MGYDSPALTSHRDHLQARCIQKQATTVGRYWRHMVVRCRLFDAIKYDVWASSLDAKKINRHEKVELVKRQPVRSIVSPLTRLQVLTTCVCGWSMATSKPNVCRSTFSLKTKSCACSWYASLDGSGGSRLRHECATFITCSNLRGCSST